MSNATYKKRGKVFKLWDFKILAKNYFLWKNIIESEFNISAFISSFQVLCAATPAHKTKRTYVVLLRKTFRMLACKEKMQLSLCIQSLGFLSWDSNLHHFSEADRIFSIYMQMNVPSIHFPCSLQARILKGTRQFYTQHYHWM